MGAGSERRRRQRSGDDSCSGGGWQQWRQTMTAVDDNSMQDWVAAYEGDGQEQAARDGKDTEWQWRLRGWKMAAVDDNSGGWWQRWRWTTTMATADDNSSKQRQGRTTTACKIKQWTTRGKEENGQQTTTALEPTRQRAWKNKEIKFTQKDFFQQYGLSSWIFCSCRSTQWYLLDLSVLDSSKHEIKISIKLLDGTLLPFCILQAHHEIFPLLIPIKESNDVVASLKIVTTRLFFWSPR